MGAFLPPDVPLSIYHVPSEESTGVQAVDLFGWGIFRQRYTRIMSIELPGGVEEQLRDLAARQGREMNTLVEEALRQYLESTAITDLDAGDVAEAQLRLVNELPNVPAWNTRDA